MQAEDLYKVKERILKSSKEEFQDILNRISKSSNENPNNTEITTTKNFSNNGNCCFTCSIKNTKLLTRVYAY